MGLELSPELLLSVPLPGRQPVSDGCYKFAGWSSQAGVIRHYEHAIWDDRNVGARTAGATEYTRCANAADYAVPIGMAGVADGARRVTRWMDSAWADVESVGLYPVAGSSKQDSGIAKVMHSAHPGQRQYCQSRQAAGLPASVDMGADPVRAPCWNCLTESWGWAPPTAMVTRPSPDTSVERWRAGFIPSSHWNASETTARQGVGRRASSLKPGNAATSCVCQRTPAESCHLAARGDVKSNHQSGGPEDNASSHQAPGF